MRLIKYNPRFHPIFCHMKKIELLIIIVEINRTFSNSQISRRSSFQHLSCPYTRHSRRSIRISIISTKNSVSQCQTLTGKERCFRILTNKCHKRRPLRYYHNASMAITRITYRRYNAICCSGLHIVGLQFIIRMALYKLSPFIHKIFFPFQTQKAVIIHTNNLLTFRKYLIGLFQ